MIKQSILDSRIISKRLVKGVIQYRVEVLGHGYVAWVEFYEGYLKIVD